MNRIHLVVLWHMHQPQYRDPEAGRYVLPWTRLHAVKDYWGMVKVLQETPEFHATFNVVPSLGMQLEEYASGKFDEPWFALAFKKTDDLTREDKVEILARAFQLNHERLMSRWPRFVELHEWSRPAGGAQALVTFTSRDWRDLQVLSQLAWMDEVWLEKDDVVSRLADKGKDYTEREKKRCAPSNSNCSPWFFPFIARRRRRDRSSSAPRPSTIPFFRCYVTPTSRALRIPEHLCRGALIATQRMRANSCGAHGHITSVCSARSLPGCGLPKDRFPIKRYRLRSRKASSGSVPTKGFSDERSTLVSSAIPRASRQMPSVCTNRGACKSRAMRSPDSFAIISSPI